MERSRLLLEGSADAEFVPQATPIEGETVVNKGCVNPFIGTNLEQRLVTLGAGDLYLAGVATNFVVESAARHAGDSGFRVTVLEDLCAAYTQEMHEFAIKNTLPMFAQISSYADFEARVGAGEVAGARGGAPST
jgi:nicotinamidase-related amidase